MLARVAGWKGRIRCSRRVEKRNARGAANDEERGKERGKATKYKVLFVMYRGRGGKKTRDIVDPLCAENSLPYETRRFGLTEVTGMSFAEFASNSWF